MRRSIIYQTTGCVCLVRPGEQCCPLLSKDEGVCCVFLKYCWFCTHLTSPSRPPPLKTLSWLQLVQFLGLISFYPFHCTSASYYAKYTTAPNLHTLQLLLRRQSKMYLFLSAVIALLAGHCPHCPHYSVSPCCCGLWASVSTYTGVLLFSVE